MYYFKKGLFKEGGGAYLTMRQLTFFTHFSQGQGIFTQKSISLQYKNVFLILIFFANITLGNFTQEWNVKVKRESSELLENAEVISLYRLSDTNNNKQTHSIHDRFGDNKMGHHILEMVTKV